MEEECKLGAFFLYVNILSLSLAVVITTSALRDSYQVAKTLIHLEQRERNLLLQRAALSVEKKKRLPFVFFASQLADHTQRDTSFVHVIAHRMLHRAIVAVTV